MRFAELKTKEIVRVIDGKKLGFAEDLVIDESTNTVVALRVPRSTRGFKKPEYFEIPFSAISKIGENVILVDEDDQKENDKKIERGEYYYSPKVFKKIDRTTKK